VPEPRADREPASPSFIYIVGRVNQGVRREMSNRLAQCGLSVREYTALSVLDARPGLSNAQLARRSLVTPQSMIEILTRLVRRGLVTRKADARHARILRATLTRKGTDLLADADQAMAGIQEQILADVPRHERAIVIEGMRAVMNRLSGGL